MYKLLLLLQYYLLTGDFCSHRTLKAMLTYNDRRLKENTRLHSRTTLTTCKINLLFSAKAAALKLLRKRGREIYNVMNEISTKKLFLS